MNTDCISRQAVIDSLYDWSNHSMTDAETWHLRQVIGDIKSMPSVTPQEQRCKDCKWWKDSDGAYRRGCGAESICRINTDKVYQGEGYCYLFEPQESEG